MICRHPLESIQPPPYFYMTVLIGGADEPSRVFYHHGSLYSRVLLNVIDPWDMPLQMPPPSPPQNEPQMPEPEYPAATKTATGTISGIPTIVTHTSFSDKIMITISQEGRLSQWVRLSTFRYFLNALVGFLCSDPLQVLSAYHDIPL